MPNPEITPGETWNDDSEQETVNYNPIEEDGGKSVFLAGKEKPEYRILLPQGVNVARTQEILRTAFEFSQGDYTKFFEDSEMRSRFGINTHNMTPARGENLMNLLLEHYSINPDNWII